MKKYSVGLYTLGCKVAQYETEAISEEFERLGFSVLPFDAVCDAYVINTCTVTAESDRKCRQIIRRASKINPNAITLVCGCYSQRNPDEVKKLSGVYAVYGTCDKLELPSVALELLKKRDSGEKLDTVTGVRPLDNAEFEKMSIKRASRTRAYVKIEDGCDSKCTYCAIKEARGHIRSKAPSDVICEVEELSRTGIREVVLVGIEIGAYGRDFSEKYDLADLILELDRRRSCERVRIGSLAPELVNESFVEKIKNAKILCPHFHLSVQSGSDKILALMKRRYTSKSALSVIENIRQNIEGAQFTTDIMVGFPHESEREFEETLEFVRRARFLDAHVFAYSRREGTEAYSFPHQIENGVKEERSRRVQELKNQIRDEILASLVDNKKEEEALVETFENGVYTAHTPSYVEVKIDAENLPCDLCGKTVWVLPVSHNNGVLNCKIINLGDI